MNKIITVPDPRLQQKSQKIKSINEEVKNTIKDLQEATEKVDKPFNFWLGMAAPQVGVNKCIFLLRWRYKNYEVFINPEIIKKTLQTPAISKCYSVDGIHFPKRYFSITLKYQDLEGEVKTRHFWGGKSWVVRHEIDHLNGVLASDYIGLSSSFS